MKTINKDLITQIEFIESKDSGDRVRKHWLFRTECVNGKLNEPVKDFLEANPTWAIEDGVIYSPYAVQVRVGGTVHTELFSKYKRGEAHAYYYKLANQIENKLEL